MNESYEPFGPEWEKEMMRFRKKHLVSILRKKLQKQAELTKEIDRIRLLGKEYSNIIHDQVVTMQAAFIEAEHNGPGKGMKWIYNTLCGPGQLPDPDAEWYNNANDWHNAYRSDPLGLCEICGHPSGAFGGGHVACGLEHLAEAKKLANQESV